ncbi:MAG: transcriptional repressor [Clostridia bacterium]|nr:transcriptional repressor [Clostridia bacterium]
MGYNTKQRKRLIETLEQHRDETLSAEQITDLVGKDSISVSAVYRNLSSLESQGLVKRIVTNGSNKVYYRYTGSEGCRSHLHLECSKCGKTIHLDKPATNNLIDTVLHDSDFKVDSSSTVLYGVCGECQDK